MKVLLAEDDFINQEVERSLLEKLGCEVSTVENGREVLAALKNERFEIIFMDCNMPEMDGYAATQAIRQQEQASNTHIPIIALTANAAYGDHERCLAVGMDGYLNKPLKTELLQDILQQWGGDSAKKPAPASSPSAVVTRSPPTMEATQVNLTETHSNSGPILNEKTITRLKREMQSQGIDWLVDLYLSELPNYLSQLQTALMCQDADALHLAAHKLKGSSHSLGAEQVMNLCKLLEDTAKENAFAQAETHFNQLKTATEQAKMALIALRESA
jgi:CheY-like chemotaxis protein/HPt (histidine-containing phosphotransfer) domain-containing protein